MERENATVAIRPNGSCIRCNEHFGHGVKCSWCGVAYDRVIRQVRRRKPVTGKRGRNSGVHGTAKTK